MSVQVDKNSNINYFFFKCDKFYPGLILNDNFYDKFYDKFYPVGGDGAGGARPGSLLEVGALRPRTAPTSKRTATKNPNFRNDFFEARPGRRAGVGNVGKAASQHPRRPRIAAPVQAQELAAARRRLASFKPVCQRGMSEISPPARRSCSCGRTCRHPNRTLARAEKGARQNLPPKNPQFIYTQI